MPNNDDEATRRDCAAVAAASFQAKSAREAVHHELSILALIKGRERYVFVYDDDSRERLLDAIRDQAASPHVSLSWFDAAVLTERARRQFTEAAADHSSRNRG